jgi:hypothetical protein
MRRVAAPAWLTFSPGRPPGHAARARPARLALLFGNSGCEGGSWLPLRNPASDAQALAQALKVLHFQIVGCAQGGICLDAPRAVMDEASGEFGRRLRASPGATGGGTG